MIINRSTHLVPSRSEPNKLIRLDPVPRHFCCAGKSTDAIHTRTLRRRAARESERSRDALASTVSELRNTVGNTAAEIKTLISPTHIKKEIRNYVREEREGVVQSIQRRAQDNPLQMAAVGAAVAYPVWSLLRAIPTPLLLIGAGLFLTSKPGQQSTKEIRAKVDDIVHQGTEKVSDLAGAMRSDLEDRLAGARYARRASRYGSIRRRRSDRRSAIRISRRRRCREGAVSGAAGQVASAAKASAPRPARPPRPPKIKPPLSARNRAMP